MEPVVEARSAPAARLLYIDNLRILLITMVIVIHVAVTYGVGGVWGYYREAGEMNGVVVAIITLMGAVGTTFFMGFFFMIASYFTPRSYDRKGARVFLLDRLKRLGIPLLLYAVVIDTLIVYLREVYFGFRGLPWQLPGFHGVIPYFPGPMWFVEALLIFSVGYTLWRLLKTGPPLPPASDGDARAPGNLSIALFAVGLGLVTFVVRIWAPVEWYFEPLHLELASFANYIALFVAGIVAYRRNWLAGLSDGQGKTWLWIAAVLLVVLVVVALATGALTGSLDRDLFGGFNWLSLIYSVWQQLMCMAMIIVLLVWFRRRFNRQGRLAKTMAESTYAVYVLHPLVIVPLAIVLSPIKMELALKFILVTPLAVALCFLVGYAVRKLPLVRDVL
jgi:peptidoglycan/LPS O-acetylase OafA/YrhL